MPYSTEFCSKVTVHPEAPEEPPAEPPSHHDGNKFKNPWDSFIQPVPSFSIFMQVRRDMNATPLPKVLPAVHRPDWGFPTQSATGSEEVTSWAKDVKTTWLGHACFLLELPAPSGATDGDGRPRGVRILFDPVWSHRCSPVSWMGPARIVPPPMPLSEIPPVDLVALSHNHYDHMDLMTLQHIQRAQPNGSPQFFIPLRNKPWFKHNIRAEGDQAVELDWWQSRDVTVQLPGGKGAETRLRMTYVPAQHMTSRSLWDRMDTLWGGWVIEHLDLTDQRVLSKSYFVGDTAYRTVPQGADESKVPTCPAFREIGARFGGFDVSMIPIGAYAPRWFMSAVHVNPEDAVEIHQEVKSKKSIGMHYGTWRLTGEDVLEPPKRLAAAMEAKGAPADEFITIEQGKTVRVMPST